MRRIFAIIWVAVLMLLSGPAFAQVGTFEVQDFKNRQDGLDQVFTFSVQNNTGRDINVSGRMIVLNVYDTAPPLSLPVNNLVIKDGKNQNVVIRWSGAPLIGQVRALLVLNVAPGMTIVEHFEFWVFPWQAFIVLTGIFLVLIGLLLTLLKFIHRKTRKRILEGPGPEKSEHLTDAFTKEKYLKVEKNPKPPKKKKRRRLPSGMTSYVVEFGDTVVTVANRFGVSWEDVVRANRLKPPYAIKVEKEILVPLHELRRPETTETPEND